jgi:hypothetical protein
MKSEGALDPRMLPHRKPEPLRFPFRQLVRLSVEHCDHFGRSEREHGLSQQGMVTVLDVAILSWMLYRHRDRHRRPARRRLSKRRRAVGVRSQATR